MTRYDEIRSMSINELAQFIIDTRDSWKCQTCSHQNNKPTCYCVDCAEIPESSLVQKWLEQEVPTHENNNEILPILEDEFCRIINMHNTENRGSALYKMEELGTICKLMDIPYDFDWHLDGYHTIIDTLYFSGKRINITDGKEKS